MSRGDLQEMEPIKINRESNAKPAEGIQKPYHIQACQLPTKISVVHHLRTTSPDNDSAKLREPCGNSQ